MSCFTKLFLLFWDRTPARTTARPCPSVPLCLAGYLLLDYAPAHLSPVASMALGDVCHGPRCSLVGVGLWEPLLLLAPCVRWVAPVRPTNRVWFVVSRPSAAPCARLCAVSWATWLLFAGVLARCFVLRVRCPKPLGSRLALGPLGVLCCVCGVLGHMAPVHPCARPVRCVACAVSWATWLRFTRVPAWCVVLRVRCPGPLGSCSPVCLLAALWCVPGVLGHFGPVQR